MNITVGTRLGRYEIRSKIGEGGMGEVYLAQDIELRRSVALKILPADVAANQERMRRFKQEAQAAAALNHPNIAHIYEIGESGGTSFIAMEFVDGLTLRQIIHEQQTEFLKLLRSLQQTAEGLAKAHAAGVIHRDLKPDNIMVTRDGHAKVLDFGLAKLLEPQQRSGSGSSEVATALMPQHSAPGTVMGTVGYMSPEQAQGRVNEIDHRSDIFSFGCILYEAITRRKAFEGKDVIDSLNKIIREQPTTISETHPDTPYDLQRIVRRCLAKDPEERYQTIKDVAIELKEVRRELQAGAGAHSTVPPPSITSTTTRTIDFDPTSLGGTSPGTSPTSTPPSSAEYIVSGIKQHKMAVGIIAGLLLAVVAAIGFGLYKFLGRNKAGAPQARKITRLTNSGKAGNATISPDGKYVAYQTRDESGQVSLWVKHVATGSNVQIVPPAGSDVSFPQSTFSPDGNYLYYLRGQSGRPLVLYQVPVLGGTSKKLLENVSGISFSPDGKRFTFSRRYQSEGEDSIIIVNADGTGEQRLATRKNPDYFLPGAAWSPDGQTIACPIGGFSGNDTYRSVGIIQVSDGSQRRLTSHTWSYVERIVWLSDGSGVLTTASQGGDQSQIWRISYPDGEAQTLTTELSDYRNLSLTADSNTMVATLYDRTSNIWVAPYGAWSSARQVTSGKLNGAPAWTPDGKLVYGSRAGGNPDIWIADADGRNQKQLTDDIYWESFLSVCRDGRYVVFDSPRSGKQQQWRMDIDGSNLKQLTPIGFQSSCSPDGQWVVYTNFGAGGFSIWKVPIDGGEPTAVVNKYALIPSLSPDGKLIACYYFDEKTSLSKIAIFPFAGGEPLKLFDLAQPVISGNPSMRWLPDGSGLTYIMTRGGVSNIWLQPIDGGEPKQLTDFKTDTIFSFNWSRDGKQLAMSRGTEDRDVILINNFR
jgi:serine/threonine protein kinase